MFHDWKTDAKAAAPVYQSPRPSPSAFSAGRLSAGPVSLGPFCWARFAGSFPLGLDTDLLAVAAPDHRHCRARHRVAAVRPVGGRLFEGGVVVLAWVLDVHHDALVGDNRTTGLRSHRDGEEAAGLTAVFALQPDRVQAVVAVQGVAVGGDPQVAVGIEGQVIRAGDRGNL